MKVSNPNRKKNLGASEGGIERIRFSKQWETLKDFDESELNVLNEGLYGQQKIQSSKNELFNSSQKKDDFDPQKSLAKKPKDFEPDYRGKIEV